MRTIVLIIGLSLIEAIEKAGKCHVEMDDSTVKFWTFLLIVALIVDVWEFWHKITNH